MRHVQFPEEFSEISSFGCMVDLLFLANGLKSVQAKEVETPGRDNSLQFCSRGSMYNKVKE